MKDTASRREKKKQILRKEIIDTGIQLFLQQGFDNTTMEQIAEKTDIAKRTLYNHFPNKESIINEYMKLAVQEGDTELALIVSKQPDTYSRLLVLMQAIHQWNEVNKEILKMHTSYRIKDFLTPNQEEIKEHTFESTLLQIIRPGQKQGELREDISAESLVKYFNSLYTTFFLSWLYDDTKKLGTKEFEEILQLFLYGAKKQ